MQSPAVSRDPWKLEVFALADEWVVDVYRATRRFPMEERLLAIALGSASEVRYLVGLAQRLELLDDATATTLTARYTSSAVFKP